MEEMSDDPDSMEADDKYFGETEDLMDADETLVDIECANNPDKSVEEESSSTADDDYIDDDDNEDNEDNEDNDDNEDDEDDEDDHGHHPIADKPGWTEDTIQTEAMARLGICINTAAKVIVCLACASAIKPLELPQHLARSHPPISASSTFSQELINTYGLHPDVDSRPGTIITAIYGLELVSGYLTCDNCGYASKTKKAMGRHTKEFEGCSTFRERPVQTFRPTSKRMYFGVNVEPEPPEEVIDSSLDPLTYLKNKFSPVPFSNIPIKSPKTARDANHFLNLEKWDLYVQGKTGAEITHAVREREPDLRQEVRICVERYVEASVNKLNGVDSELRAAMGDYHG